MDNEISKRVEKLLNAYPTLMLKEETDNTFVISGVIDVHRNIGQYVLNKSYEIMMNIPKKEGSLPCVFDVGKAIDAEYPHLYPDGMLCLATDVDMQIAFTEEPSLVRWMRNYVEPYFVSYEYYERYGSFPMGERPHGSAGIIQSYMDFFDADELQAKRMIYFLAYKNYRGHQPCPCGSGIRMRKCHGKKLLKFYNNPVLIKQARMDCIMVVREVAYNANPQ